MSATSGKRGDHAQRGARRRGAEHSDDDERERELASREAMAVTPDEGGPLQREALVVRPRGADVVELAAQALEPDGCQVTNAGRGALALRVAERSASSSRSAPPDRDSARLKKLEVRVAAVAAGSG